VTKIGQTVESIVAKNCGGGWKDDSQERVI
jgi:hypothetical protein